MTFSPWLSSTLILGVAVALIMLIQPAPVQSQTAGDITGWAWSENIGWISMHCSTGGASGGNICASYSYGLSVDVDGEVSGYAWSDNIGWISAQGSDLSGCPDAPCSARIEDGKLLGWLKVLSGGVDGWDGFISLGDTDPEDAIDYGVTQASSTLSGYAWGDTIVGWVQFSGTAPDFGVETAFREEGPCEHTQGYSCVLGTASTSRHLSDQCVETFQTCSNFCALETGTCVPVAAPSGALRANPMLVPPGGSSVLSWEIEDAESCTVTEDNALIEDVWTGLSSAAAECTHSGGGCTSGAINDPTTYTLTCIGTEGTSLMQSVTITHSPRYREI